MIFPKKKIVRESVGRLLQFECPMDVYNPSVPFVSNGDVLIAGRVEERSGNISKVVFFKKKGDVYSPIPDGPVFPLEDPFVSLVQGKLVFGGVEVDRGTGVYRTVFYVGMSIYDLESLAAGPPRMKDIRMVGLIDGTIGIFTRPQGGIGGLGKIGFMTIADLRELSEGVILSASLIEDQFGPKRWGGVNQALLLTDGTLGVVGHLAWFEQNGAKHYITIAFEFNPQTRESTKMKIIAERKNFPKTEAKRWDLEDVVFTSGLTFREDGSIELYAGLSDVAAGCLLVEWPFSQPPLDPVRLF